MSKKKQYRGYQTATKNEYLLKKYSLFRVSRMNSWLQGK